MVYCQNRNLQFIYGAHVEALVFALFLSAFRHDITPKPVFENSFLTLNIQKMFYFETRMARSDCRTWRTDSLCADM